VYASADRHICRDAAQGDVLHAGRHVAVSHAIEVFHPTAGPLGRQRGRHASVGALGHPAAADGPWPRSWWYGRRGIRAADHSGPRDDEPRPERPARSLAEDGPDRRARQYAVRSDERPESDLFRRHRRAAPSAEVRRVANAGPHRHGEVPRRGNLPPQRLLGAWYSGFAGWARRRRWWQ